MTDRNHTQTPETDALYYETQNLVDPIRFTRMLNHARSLERRLRTPAQEPRAWMRDKVYREDEDGCALQDVVLTEEKAEWIAHGGKQQEIAGLYTTALYLAPLAVQGGITERQADAYRQQYDADQRTIFHLRMELTARSDKENGHFWYWQGDGTDKPETLTCPILIRPEELRALSRLSPATTATGGEAAATQFPHNPAHKIGTCGNCGSEMAYNIPRLGASGGFVHVDGGLLCAPSHPRGEGV